MPLTVYLKELGVIYKRKKFLPPEGTEGDGLMKSQRNTKITKSTTARLIFLGPKLSGYKTLFVSFLKHL